MGDHRLINTKESIRNMIWNHMEKEGISRTNSFGRIPDFHGSEKAADLLMNSPEWKNTQIIFVSPDTAQRKVRENAFYGGKELIMPISQTPRRIYPTRNLTYIGK
jgi:5-formyltetrahydrofolate cyclo-ligase